MEETSGANVPAYQKIQQALQEHIRRKRLKPGDVLPSERELARKHDVSLMTARSALAALERQGVVERRRGAGTFVAVPRIQYNKLVSTTELMAGRGFRAHSRVLNLELVADQPEIAARLGKAEDEQLVKLERLRQVANEPLAVETSYLAGQFRALFKKPLKGGSLFTMLEEVYGIELAYADEEVDAMAADPRTAGLLDIPEGAPVLRIRQTIHAATGEAVLYVAGLYRSDRHKLMIRRFRK
jgi:GntR family transcriptional regulator